MSIVLDTAQGRAFLKRALCVVYDLEFVGPKDDFTQAKLWDMSAQVMHGSACFEASCVPCAAPLPPPCGKEYVPLTKAWLKKLPHLMSKRGLLDAFLSWCMEQMCCAGKSCVVLLAHGNMKSDKVVLECECQREKVQIPHFMYFYDTLPFFRRTFPSMRTFRLSHVASALHGKRWVSTHRARDDVLALHACLTYVCKTRCLDGCVYAAYHTPLQNIRGIGYHTERRLHCVHAVRSVEELALLCVHVQATTEEQVSCVCQALLGMPAQYADLAAPQLMPHVDVMERVRKKYK